MRARQVCCACDDVDTTRTRCMQLRLHRACDWTTRVRCVSLVYVMHLPNGTRRAANTQEVEPAFPPCSQATAAGCLVQLPVLGRGSDDLRPAREGSPSLGHRR